MARKRLMNEAKQLTVVIDQSQYDSASELVNRGVHSSISDVFRSALSDYLGSAYGYVEPAINENKDENMARSKTVDGGRSVSVYLDEWCYDVLNTMVEEGAIKSISEGVRIYLTKGLKDDGMDEYVNEANKDRVDKIDRGETKIGSDINGNDIWVPNRVFATMTLQSHVDDYITRHNAMLDPDFYKTIDQ